jgi:hypothetical protein
MADLSELFNKYGSDKDRNGYTQLYHTLFHKMKNEPIVMLEIGIGTMIPGAHSSMVGYALNGYAPGGSLRAWRDYFTEGKIIGADVQPDTQFSDEPRIETYICNSTSPLDSNNFMEKLDVQFDIIIDDGSHVDHHQLLTLQNFYKYLKPGGIYIIEDIYPGSLVSTNPGVVAFLCNYDPYFFVGLKNNLCVIYKEHINSKRENY